MSPAKRECLHQYADEIAIVGGLCSTRLRHALSIVPRADFLPPGPWVIERLDGTYYHSVDDDRRRVLHSVGVALDPERGLNNGNPANISRLIEAIDPRPGEHVLHVGAGVGYYTAVIAELVGPEGHVVAAEIDPDLNARAADNLKPWPHVALAGDATRLTSLGPLDVVFCSCGAADIPLFWLRALKVGGRMLLPLTGSIQGGPIFLLERLQDPDHFSARMLTAQRYFPCLGTRGAAAEAAVDAAIARSSPQEVSGLWLGEHPPGGQCWLHGSGWCLRRS